MKLIDADKLIKKVWEINGVHILKVNGIKSIFGIPMEEITVDAERHGKWIIIGRKTDSEYVLIFKCSCCHTPFIGMVDRYHYCPNCGAKIDEIEEGEVVVTKKEIERIKDCANFSKMDEADDFCSRGERK